MSCGSGTILGLSSIATTRLPNFKFCTRVLCPFSRFSLFAGNHQLSTTRQRRFSPNATSLELPLLPFNMGEVLVPSESKTLHLYEARYLALLEESLLRKKNLFVHFVLDLISSSGTEASFAARYGCLVIIENVRLFEILKTFRAFGVGPLLAAQGN
ncbi:uncharacterized protein LOC105644307 [Jatropha curcas]|uniref:uncharacterized protein LOC105644307 n=1 Tax=Jatropha curcas TaxID=180498 RepID=UPI00189528EE|nr:uncharacterized protein LOC105644307 [Jatropha curcas]